MTNQQPEIQSNGPSKGGKGYFKAFRSYFSCVPMFGWLAGIIAAVLFERFLGDQISELLGLPKIPVLFGCMIMLKDFSLIPSALAFLVGVYFIPILLVGRALAPVFNGLAGMIYKISPMFSVVLHLALLYLALHLWADLSAYRLMTLKFTLVAVMLTLSLNVINGYMGEFSCSHPGFMALGAYAASVFTLVLFTNDRFFGEALLSPSMGVYFFPVAIILGGFAAALGALVIAIPSFRTRGDYLAIISLAFMFIVKSLIENLEVVGGPRGLGSQPNYASLPMVFGWTVLCIWVINNFVRSTLGKALNAVRDDESAADAMTVNTRRTKMVGFLFGAFWAGAAGGLFAHILRYVNPASFGLQRLAEILAMVYFGGLNSVHGSIVGAVSISLLGEALRPLELFKWIIIPLLLILVMIFRPTGLIAFKEFNVKQLVRPRN